MRNRICIFVIAAAVLFNINVFADKTDYGSGAVCITEAEIPRENAELKWAVQYAEDWTESFTPPVLANGYIYTVKDNRVLKINKADGSLAAESEPLEGSTAFSTIAAAYGGGMIFVPIGGGRIQAVDADNLTSLWVSDGGETGGQTISPVIYYDGCIYTGTWNGEELDGEFFCIDTADTDKNSVSEIKPRKWSIKHRGGFYWVGAYVSDKYVIFGSDDGTEDFQSDTSVLYCADRITGEITDKIEGLHGDLRSAVTYDELSGCVYFTSKGKRLYKVPLKDGGKFGNAEFAEMDGSSTAAPIVYKNMVFVGMSGESAFEKTGHKYAVIDSDSMKIIKTADVPGYPQANGILSRAYEKENKLYLYTAYNAEPGGIYEIEIADTADSISLSGRDLFVPDEAMRQYCVCSLTADDDGTLYYKNDSGYMMAVGSVYGFSDIKNHWAETYIRDLTEKGIINGRNAGVFAPDDSITHAEFTAVLYRMSGENAVTSADFHDVEKDSWYESAVCWAAENGIAGGTPDGSFMPERPVNREQMAVMIDNYMKHMNIILPEINGETVFSDIDSVSGWASESVMRMKKTGVISGMPDGRFAPKDSATRAEAVKMLSALMQD